MSDQQNAAPDLVRVRIALDLVLDAHGGDHLELERRANEAVHKAFESGRLMRGHLPKARHHPQPADGGMQVIGEQMLANWLKQRLDEGDIQPADLADLAARYALAERAALLEELQERMQEWSAEREPGLDDVRGAFADALSRGMDYGFAVSRGNVQEVVREELVLAGFQPQDLGPSLDSLILSMFDELGDVEEQRAHDRPRQG